MTAAKHSETPAEAPALEPVCYGVNFPVVDASAQLSNDLNNLIGNVNLPVIVGQDLYIRRFTPLVEKLLNLIATDIGRPIRDIKPHFDIPDIGKLTREAINSVRALQVEAQDRGGRWYSVRIQPYRTLDNQTTGR